MVVQKKKQKKQVNFGVAHIKSSFNNTTITLCDVLGNTLSWASAGTLGYKGARKSTAFAAQQITKNLLLKAAEMGMQKIHIIVRGRGNGRDSAIRALLSGSIRITSLEDKSVVPHNGCRPPKKRRL